ncbi:MAG: IS3 family transposase [Butyricimonas virosa]
MFPRPQKQGKDTDYYNNNRIKSRLKGKSPVQYRTLSING